MSFRASRRRVEKSTPSQDNFVRRSLDFARDDSVCGSLKQYDKLKFEGGRFVNRPYEVTNRAGPMVLVYRRSEGPKCQRRLAAKLKFEISNR